MSENLDVINNPDASDADVYMAMLKESFGISFAADAVKDADVIRKWWIREKPNRQKYGLSKEQEDEIIKMCQVAVSLLPEPEPPPKMERYRPQDRRDRMRGRR